MSNILLIETSTALCSVALEQDGKVLAYRESTQARVHASMTAVYIKEVLEETGYAVKDCDAICVSKGPGSYTGLRVGSSTAKGLCFGAGKPLISVGTLEILLQHAIENGLAEGCKYVVPMIDARRMEVYATRYAHEEGEWKEVSEVTPIVVDENSFRDILTRGKVLFIGDGAQKCSEVLSKTAAEVGSEALFVQCNPTAADMAIHAERALRSATFENIAYFEPFYLKEFIATTGKKPLGF